MQWLVTLGAGDLPRADAVSPDARIAAFTLGVALLTGVLFGLLPAMRASRADVGGILREGGRTGTEGRSRFGARGGIIVAETALAMVLLVSAGLMLKSFWRLVNVDPGFRAENVLVLSITPPETEYENAVDLIEYRSRLIERLKQIPGVAAVGGSKTLPLRGGGEEYEFHRGDRPEVTVKPEAGVFMVTPEYFRALGIPLLRGRDFTESMERDRLSIIVNQALANRTWPGEDLLDKKLRLPRFDDAELPVIGVVGNVRSEGLTAEPQGALYVSMMGPFSRSTSKLFVRTTTNPLAIIGAVRAAIHELAPNQPISDVTTLQQLVAGTVARPRLFTTLIAGFGGAAMVLALLGIYGVTSYAVSRRSREIGIRKALGAQNLSVLEMVLGRSLVLAGSGVVIGAAAALAVTRVLASQLYGVSTTDPATFIGVALLLIAVALLAASVPARRATRVDPMIALRAE
ncbi:hypothetical protein BH23GEM4_BH23GEM4_06870 [soil metagenome]